MLLVFSRLVELRDPRQPSEVVAAAVTARWAWCPSMSQAQERLPHLACLECDVRPPGSATREVGAESLAEQLWGRG